MLLTSRYLAVFSSYLVVTSGYLMATTGYFWLFLVTSSCLSLILVPRFSNNKFVAIFVCSFLSCFVKFQLFSLARSSHRSCSVKKSILKNFSNFSGKHLCWSLVLIKLQAFRPATLLKRDSNTGVIL